MLRRLIYAGGILGILSLVFVQSGSFASFTSTANVDSKISTGMSSPRNLGHFVSDLC